MHLDIKIENFKSIRSAQLNLHQGLNILMGPNASGKTCLLSALEFVRDVLQLGAAQALARSGGANRVYHRGRDTISFTISHDYGKRVYKRRKHPCRLTWVITIAQRGVERIGMIIIEKMTVTAPVDGRNKILFSLEIDRRDPDNIKSKTRLAKPEELGKDLFSAWDRYSGKSKSSIYKELGSAVRRRVRQVKVNPDTSVFPSIAQFDRRASELFSRFLFLNEYDILPAIARAASEQFPFAQMRPDGGQVSEVIHALENKHFHRIEAFPEYEIESAIFSEQFGYRTHRYFAAHFQRFRYWPSPKRRLVRLHTKTLEHINKELSAAVSPIDSVSVQIDPTSGKRFVVFRAGNESFYPEEVSDGTVKWLCLLVSIFVPYSTVYLLEEPENFLHPWMQQRLVEIMRGQAKDRGTIFVLTSHSATVLNAATPQEILIVKQSTNGTEVNELKNRKEIESVLKESDFGLGDLWVSGGIGGVPTDE